MKIRIILSGLKEKLLFKLKNSSVTSKKRIILSIIKNFKKYFSQHKDFSPKNFYVFLEVFVIRINFFQSLNLKNRKNTHLSLISKFQSQF